MKKVLFTLLVLVSFIGISQAQSNMSLGAGVVVSLPMGDFGDAANTGFGGTAQFELGFTPQLVGVGSVGYLTWGTDADNVSFSAVPVLVGVKYFFMPTGGFYGMGQLGLSFFSIETPSVTIPGFGTVGGGSASESEFTLVIGAGYEVPLSPTVNLDLAGGFNIISDANHITVRAGVEFEL